MNARARTILSTAFALVATLTSRNVLAGVGEWTSNGPHGGTIVNLAADPSNPATIYAATDRQVYKSVDGGQSWAVTLYGRFDRLLPTSDPSVVYASSGGQPSVYVTADGGGHWVSHSTPISGNPLVDVADLAATTGQLPGGPVPPPFSKAVIALGAPLPSLT